MDDQSAVVETLPKPSSFFTRISNVFAAPGELFAELAVQPVQTSSWMIPLILSILMMVGMSVAIFTNDSLREQALEPQREQMQKMVQDGRITQEQADQQAQIMEGSKLMLVFGGLGALGTGVVIFFAVPFVLWLSAKFLLKFGGGYLKIVEIYGLTALIGILGGIVAYLMMNIFNSIAASPGGWLALMQSYDRHKFIHNIIAAINVFTIWEISLVGFGLSRVSGKSTGIGMSIVFILWGIFVVATSLLGWGIH